MTIEYFISQHQRTTKVIWGKLFKKKNLEYFVKVSNGMTNDNYVSNLKGVTVFSIHFWELLSFRQISREGIGIYHYLFIMKLPSFFKWKTH